MTSLKLNSKLCNFITRWNLTKMTQNFVLGSFSITLTKIHNKTGVMFWLQAHSHVWDNFWKLKVLQKRWKMLFISTWNLFLFSRYSNFYFDFLVMQKIDLIRERRLISKFMMSQHGNQTIAIHILSSISRNNANQTVTFG